MLVKTNPRRRTYPATLANFDTVFNNLFNQVPAAQAATRRMPAINVAESEYGYRLEIAAPGFGKENFTLEVENDILTIAGKVEEKTQEGEKYTRREFKSTEFKRTFHLPETVDANAIEAQVENGVLFITLKLKESEKPAPARQIEIA